MGIPLLGERTNRFTRIIRQVIVAFDGVPAFRVVLAHYHVPALLCATITDSPIAYKLVGLIRALLHGLLPDAVDLRFSLRTPSLCHLPRFLYPSFRIGSSTTFTDNAF